MYISVAACATTPEDAEVAVGVVVAAADEEPVALVMHFCSISIEVVKDFVWQQRTWLPVQEVSVMTGVTSLEKTSSSHAPNFTSSEKPTATESREHGHTSQAASMHGC